MDLDIRARCKWLTLDTLWDHFYRRKSRWCQRRRSNLGLKCEESSQCDQYGGAIRGAMRPRSRAGYKAKWLTLAQRISKEYGEKTIICSQDTNIVFCAEGGSTTTFHASMPYFKHIKNLMLQTKGCEMLPRQRKNSASRDLHGPITVNNHNNLRMLRSLAFDSKHFLCFRNKKIDDVLNSWKVFRIFFFTS